MAKPTSCDHTNRLANEKSPYLLQHARNPVYWYPWGEEAFDRAIKEDKPIFLSIGYSTCHWCHVMERESFEDQEVAQVLNRYYIAIKVDREERPDIDLIYMAACQALTGEGGWPLTVIMTPDKKPFFAGTYFPKRSKWGRAGLLDILEQIAHTWLEDRDKVMQTGSLVTDKVKEFDRVKKESYESPVEITKRGYNLFRQAFDEEYGGFGSAPKFPTPHNIMFLLRYWKLTGEPEALSMAEKTLRAIYRGGINDHIGFGFARYATDRKWLVPHFEKMLYDNALLALSFLEAHQATQDRFYAEAARRIFTYVLRDMTHSEGAFYSAEDADSEGVEGKFYVWKPAEVLEVLGKDAGDIFCRVYDINESGNFEGQSIPNLINSSPAEHAGRLGMDEIELETMLEECRQKLFTHRKKRIPPFKDDKILTAWNGLMIAALARGAAVLGNNMYKDAAQRAEYFIREKLQRADGRLMARYRDGEPAFTAYLDDYAFLIWGLIELYQATFIPDYLSRAIELTGKTMELFWDRDKGGFYFYGADAEQLITRPKEVYDGATPSGNSVMALNLIYLSALSGDRRLADIAERQMSAFTGTVAEYPRGYAHFMNAMLLAAGPLTEVVVVGRQDDAGVAEMLRRARRRYTPYCVIIYRPEGDHGRLVEDLAPFTKEKNTVNGKCTAYVCRNRTCREPVTDPEVLERLLQ